MERDPVPPPPPPPPRPGRRPGGPDVAAAPPVTRPTPPSSPPLASARTPAAGTVPPAGWPRPPVSEQPSPPRAVPPLRLGPTSPPTGPPPPPPGQPTSRPRSGWWLLLAALVVASGSAVGGFFVGRAIDDGPRPVLTPVTGSSTRPASTGPAPLTPEPGPLAGEDAEEPVAAVAAAVAPSVVRIETQIGQGSGIVWRAADGYIVTNAHVVQGAREVQVRFADGTEVTGEVVGADVNHDVAVVQVDPTGLHLVEAVFAPTETVEVGQLAVAIGSPFSLDQTVTAGVVSAVGRINREGGADPRNPVPVEMIQTDAPINPGNSGGALADRQGRVIGMNTSIRTDGQTEGNIGVGFAIPADTIELIASRIVNGEPLDTGFLGISGQDATDGGGGAIVTEVVAGSAAEAAGLEVGDRIVSVDGDPIAEMAELAAKIKLYRPGDAVEIEIDREGRRFVTTAVLGDPQD